MLSLNNSLTCKLGLKDLRKPVVNSIVSDVTVSKIFDANRVPPPSCKQKTYKIKKKVVKKFTAWIPRLRLSKKNELGMSLCIPNLAQNLFCTLLNCDFNVKTLKLRFSNA